MTWNAPEIAHRGWPHSTTEREALVQVLALQQDTLRWKCGGLTGEQLARKAVQPSGMSLLGIVRHMAKNEREVLRIAAAREVIEELYPEPNEDFDSLNAGAADADFTTFDTETAAARAAIERLSLDAIVPFHGESWSLRSILLLFIGEYAQHNGHADLLRERIDGATGDYF